ncbi:MAG: hypothetical protein ABIM18_03925 [candidate division WOR-3 bacterium]
MGKIKENYEDENQRDINSITEEVEAQLKRMKSLGIEDKNRLFEYVIWMIEFQTSLTQDVERRRENLYHFTYLLLGGGVAIYSWLFNKVPSSFICYFLAIPYLVPLIFVLILFEVQSGYFYVTKEIDRDRNYNVYGNQPNWFYYGNKEILKIKTSLVYSLPFFRNKVTGNLDAFLSGLRKSVEEFRKDAESVDVRLEKAIKQFYVLQVHNYYKNRFYLQLNAVRRTWCLLVIVSVLVYILFGDSIGKIFESTRSAYSQGLLLIEFAVVLLLSFLSLRGK